MILSATFPSLKSIKAFLELSNSYLSSFPIWMRSHYLSIKDLIGESSFSYQVISQALISWFHILAIIATIKDLKFVTFLNRYQHFLSILLEYFICDFLISISLDLSLFPPKKQFDEHKLTLIIVWIYQTILPRWVSTIKALEILLP